MKKLLLFTFFVALLGNVFAQGDIKNTTYINLSWFRPTGDGIWDLNDNDTKDEYDITGSGDYFIDAHGQDIKSAKTDMDAFSFGGSVSFGGNYFINALPIYDGIRVGIIAEYLELSANYFTGSFYNTDGDKFNDVHLKLSPKIGIQFSYQPMDIMRIDVYGRWAPMAGIWFYNNEEYYWNYDGISRTTLEYALNRTSIGLSYRISVMTLGVEYIFGKTATDIYLPSSEGADDDPRTADILFKDNVFKLSLGFCFEPGQ